MIGYTLRFDTTNDAPALPTQWQTYRLVVCPRCGEVRPVPASCLASGSTCGYQPGYVCACGWWVQP